MLVIGNDLCTLERYTKKINHVDSSKKVLLDLPDDKVGSIRSHLDSLVVRKNDLVADVEYLAQTLDYTTFQEFNCQRAALFYKNWLKLVWDEYKETLSSSITND